MVDTDPPKFPSSPAAQTQGSTSQSIPLARRRFFKRRAHKIALLCIAVCLVVTAWFVPPVYWLIDGPVIVTRYTKKNGEIRVLVGPNEKDWTPFRKMSRHFVNAVVAAEDGKFYQHRGLDFLEIKRSYETNRRKNRYARGGSTITQQVVKMAFLGREKTLVRKAREAVGALFLEILIPKEKILEWYLNLVELGDGVYGIAAGSQHYFRTKPELLSIEQSVHLALVLPSPNGWSKGLRNQNLTRFGHKRFAAILLRMRQSGAITSSQWMTAVSRGNFGKPIAGYASLLAREEASKKEGKPQEETSLEEDCTLAPECDDLLQEDFSPPEGNSPPSVTAPSSEPLPQTSEASSSSAPRTTVPENQLPATPPLPASATELPPKGSLPPQTDSLVNPEFLETGPAPAFPSPSAAPSTKPAPPESVSPDKKPPEELPHVETPGQGSY